MLIVVLLKCWKLIFLDLILMKYCIKYISDCLKEDNGDNCKTIAFKF